MQTWEKIQKNLENLFGLKSTISSNENTDTKKEFVFYSPTNKPILAISIYFSKLEGGWILGEEYGHMTSNLLDEIEKTVYGL